MYGLGMVADGLCRPGLMPTILPLAHFTPPVSGIDIGPISKSPASQLTGWNLGKETLLTIVKKKKKKKNRKKERGINQKKEKEKREQKRTMGNGLVLGVASRF
jgi:hypothetical protein